MNPFELDGGNIRLYHADCLSVLPEIRNEIEFVTVTDPPFNVGYNYGEYNDSLTEDEYRNILIHSVKPPCVLIHYPEAHFFFADATGVMPSKCVSWIYHANTPRQWRMVSWYDIEPDFTGLTQPYRNQNDKRIQKLIADGKTGSRLYDWWEIEQVKNVSSEKTQHPCQMPLVVMDRIIHATPSPETICDPFMGSGTTGVACVRNRRKFIGIEMDSNYFQIAAQRIEREIDLRDGGGPLMRAGQEAK